MARGLQTSTAAWQEVRTAYGWVHQAAHLLNNEAGLSLFDLRRAYRCLLREMACQRATVGSLAPAVAHFLKVTRSHWPGLFWCYQVPDLPRTNNDLEHFFGSARYHERRASGRKVASPTLVVRGRVRAVAAVATQHQCFTPEQLRPYRLGDWRTLRQELEQRQQTRRDQSRFRKDPAAYLARAEALLLQPTLPS